MKIPYSDNELKIVSENFNPRRPELPSSPVYNFPVSPKEAYLGFMRNDPIWQITDVETTRFCPSVYPDNVARGFIIEKDPPSKIHFGGQDMFGVEWKYDEDNRGSAVVPGDPLFTSADCWEDKLVWPEVDSWDWEGSAKANESLTSGDTAIFPIIMTGYFERLVSFMDFGNAAIALIEQYQQAAVRALFEKLTDLYIHIIDNFIDYFDADGFIVHDDWGSQNGPLFSASVAESLIVPPMKRLTNHIHSHQRIAELHSCGLLEMQMSNIIAAGWDAWSPQPINDTQMMYDKYGDKIVIGVVPDQFDTNIGDEEQRMEAFKFVDKFCNKDKPALLSNYGSAVLTPAYREELYKLSRQKYYC